MIGIDQFKSCQTPMDPECHPELDESPIVDAEHISKHRSMIGSLNWILTLGRFDIAHSLNTMSRCSMAPREGHCKNVQRLFGCLSTCPKGQTIIDTGEAPVRDTAIVNSGFKWQEFYPDACEDVPNDAPKPQGNTARLTCHVDADHARDKVTRKSVTGIVLLFNNTPLTWISKRQKTVETSTHGSELVAAKVAVELLIEWRHKLRMLGLQLEEQSWMVGDNMSVVINTTLPSSSLKKKHLACNCHRIREAIAGHFVIFGHIDSDENVADLCTKPLNIKSFQHLTAKYLFRQPDTLKKAKTPEGKHSGRSKSNDNAALNGSDLHKKKTNDHNGGHGTATGNTGETLETHCMDQGENAMMFSSRKGLIPHGNSMTQGE